MDERFWTERSVPDSPSWPFNRGRFMSRYNLACGMARNKRVLDVACGVGYGSYLLATDGCAASVLGLDISDAVVAHASTHYRTANLRFEVRDGEDILALGRGRFDLVVSMGTLEHIRNPDAFAAAVNHVLTDGGIWLVTMLNPSAHEGMDPYHSQEWEVGEFHEFLKRHFPVAEIRWHVMLETGLNKDRRNAARYGFAPVWLRSVVKKAMGRAAAARFSQKGAAFCEADDYAWMTEPAETALEFLGICRRSS
jgi:SAM-dependent methyltransferase